MTAPASQAVHWDRLGWLISAARETPDGACRDWPGAVNDKGYPTIKWDGRQSKASHVMLEVSGRPRPDASAWALHSCDRPRCLAPWHLRWGTHQDNVDDKLSRGHSWRPRGAVNRQSKLTNDAVREIRTSSEPYRVLAAKYGVHIKTVAKVRAGKTWAHVENAA